MNPLAEYERDHPEFRKRADALEPRLRAKIMLDQPVDLGDLARELEVPIEQLHIVGIWVAGLVTDLGKPFKLTVTGLPQ
jgi:hypothetical protein